MEKLLMIFFTIMFLNACENQKKNPPIPKSGDSGINIDTAPSNKQSTDTLESFTSFWKVFKQAVIQSDTVQIKSLTNFPIEYRGPFDDDPVVKVNESNFSRLFFLFLNQWSGQDLEGSTELDIIKKTEAPIVQNEDKEIRVANLWFFRKDNRWKLGSIYLNEETIDLLKK